MIRDRYNVEEMYTDTSVKSKLIISKVNAADSGRYVCVAENSLGKHEAAMELEIKGTRENSRGGLKSPNVTGWTRNRRNCVCAVLGSPPDDLSCNVTTPNSVRLRWTDLNANNLMNDYVQGYVLTYSKVVAADDLISEYSLADCRAAEFVRRRRLSVVRVTNSRGGTCARHRQCRTGVDRENDYRVLITRLFRNVPIILP